MKARQGPLGRKVHRLEERICASGGRVLSGRQRLRAFTGDSQTGEIARELRNVTHLRALPHPGDTGLNDFLEARSDVENHAFS